MPHSSLMSASAQGLPGHTGLPVHLPMQNQSPAAITVESMPPSTMVAHPRSIHLQPGKDVISNVVPGRSPHPGEIDHGGGSTAQHLTALITGQAIPPPASVGHLAASTNQSIIDKLQSPGMPPGPVSQQLPHGPITQQLTHGPVSQQLPHGPVSQQLPHGPVSQQLPHGLFHSSCLTDLFRSSCLTDLFRSSCLTDLFRSSCHIQSATCPQHMLQSRQICPFILHSSLLSSQTRRFQMVQVPRVFPLQLRLPQTEQQGVMEANMYKGSTYGSS